MYSQQTDDKEEDLCKVCCRTHALELGNTAHTGLYNSDLILQKVGQNRDSTGHCVYVF